MGAIKGFFKDMTASPDYEKLKKINKKFKDTEDKNIKGLGGWLVLVQIGLWISLLISLYLILSTFLSSEGFNHLYLVFSFLYFCFIAYTLFLMYSYDKKFPIFAVIGIWLPFISPLMLFMLALFGVVVGAVTASDLGEFLGGLLALSLGAVIWTAYFLKSQRVKNTFTK